MRPVFPSGLFHAADHQPFYITLTVKDAATASNRDSHPPIKLGLLGSLSPPLLTRTPTTRNAFPPFGDRKCSGPPVQDFVCGTPTVQALGPPKENMDANPRHRSPQDAQVIFHAVAVGVLPMVTRRLDTEERRAIASGSVFVWEERGPNPEATGLGIERWTDGKRWGPSRVRDEFLFYQEKGPDPIDVDLNSDSDTTLGSGSRLQNNPRQEPVRSSLVKQTYSVYVETSRGRRKWHLIAYFTADTVDGLRTVSGIPELARLNVPPGKYRSARHPPRHRAHRDDQGNHAPSHQQFAPYPSPARLLNPVLQGTMPLVVSNGDGPRVPMSLEQKGQMLAPLVYLQNLPPPRRHPVDEEILMTLYPSLT